MNDFKVYKYSGSFKNGVRKRGVVVAKNRDDAIALLRKKGVYVTSIRKLPDFVVKFYTPSASAVALMFDGFLKMTRAGLNIEAIISNLINEQISPAVTIGLYKMLLAAREGHPIHYIFKASDMFGDDVIAIIESGTEAGRLEDVYANLKDFYLQRQKIKKAIIGAVSYPAAVIALAFFALMFIAPKVLQPIGEAFRYVGNGKVQMPTITIIVMDVVDFLKEYGVFVIAALVLAVKLLVDRYKSSPSFKRKMDKILIRTPLYGEFIARMSVFRFILSLSLLYKAGVPIAEALKIATETQPNEVIKDDFLDVVKSVSEGQNLSKAVKKSFYMPDVAKSLIAIGESAGSMDEQLDSIKEFSKESFGEYVSRFNKIMQPVAMLILGVIIAALLAAVYVPMFSLVDLANGG